MGHIACSIWFKRNSVVRGWQLAASEGAEIVGIGGAIRNREDHALVKLASPSIWFIHQKLENNQSYESYMARNQRAIIKLETQQWRGLRRNSLIRLNFVLIIKPQVAQILLDDMYISLPRLGETVFSLKKMPFFLKNRKTNCFTAIISEVKHQNEAIIIKRFPVLTGWEVMVMEFSDRDPVIADLCDLLCQCISFSLCLRNKAWNLANREIPE